MELKQRKKNILLGTTTVYTPLCLPTNPAVSESKPFEFTAAPPAPAPPRVTGEKEHGRDSQAEVGWQGCVPALRWLW